MPPRTATPSSNAPNLTTDPLSGTAELQAAIQLPEEITAEGMYLEGDHLHSLLSSGWWAYSVRGISNQDTGRANKSNYTRTTSPTRPNQNESIISKLRVDSSPREGLAMTSISSRATRPREGLDPHPATEAEALANADILDSVDENRSHLICCWDWAVTQIFCPNLSYSISAILTSRHPEATSRWHQAGIGLTAPRSTTAMR